MAGNTLGLSNTRRRLGVFVSLSTSCLVALACGDDGTGPKEQRIGVLGGSTTLADGEIVLTVPPDALSEFVTFTAIPMDSALASPLVVSGSQHRLGPVETTFDRLVTMVLSYDPLQLPEGVREMELRLYRESGQTWVVAANSSVDTVNNSVSGLIDRLGTFAAAGVPTSFVELQPQKTSVAVGQSEQFVAFGRGSGGMALPERKVEWESDDPSVASVDSTGLVTGVGLGETVIRATIGGADATAAIRVSDCVAQTSIPVTECEAIIDLYAEVTLGDWESLFYWMADPDPCEWRGVTCEGGTVVEFALSSSDGGGRIPHTISDLSNLRVLDLYFNMLTGVIPSNLADLERLEVLRLNSNRLSGSVPSELGALAELVSLNLSSNTLTGSIPPALGELSKLEFLKLGNNDLTGEIPAELGSLQDLKDLSLLGNQLTGFLPAELGNLTRLESLGLSANQLTGPIPSALGNLTALTAFHVSRNQLTGGVPASLANLVNLEAFSLHENQLSGLVPIEVAILGGLIQENHKKSDCWWVPPGNEGMSLPDTQAYHDADLDGDGKICGLTIGAG